MILVFATNNNNKVIEIQALLNDKIKIASLSDINCLEDIPETKDTIERNASQKAIYVYERYQVNCFADDTGLEIEALGGRPGVLSARYAGETRNAQDNINKVLDEMQGIQNRNACFKTVLSLIINGKETLFEGNVRGIILEKKRGNNGFGYDPIFQPLNYNLSFAEMDMELKNKISHRGIAIGKLVRYLISA